MAMKTWKLHVEEWITSLGLPNDTNRALAIRQMRDFAEVMDAVEGDVALEAFSGPRFAAGLDPEFRGLKH